jgi:hypothetical protein
VINHRLLFILGLAIIGVTLQIRAADSTAVRQRSFELFEWGGSLGIGFVNEDIPEGNYGPFLLMGHLEFHAHRKQRNPASNHFLLLFGEPQVNPVVLGGGIKEWELGCNIGMKYLLRIRELNGIFFHAGSGPHYISLDSPEHQADGFVFANNFGIGYERLFKRDIRISVGYRFRHASNLDLQQPNLGLDNHFFTIGFKKDFEHRLQERRLRKTSASTIDQ